MIDVIYELSTMRPILTGPAEKIREHLLKASPEYADLWVLHHSESGRTVSVSEYLTFTAPKPVPVSEDRIRQIIREELANLLRSLGTTAYDLDTYLSNDVAESVALRSIKDVVEKEADYLPHAWYCGKRDRRSQEHKCTCGVGENR